MNLNIRVNKVLLWVGELLISFLFGIEVLFDFLHSIADPMSGMSND